MVQTLDVLGFTLAEEQKAAIAGLGPATARPTITATRQMADWLGGPRCNYPVQPRTHQLTLAGAQTVIATTGWPP